MAIQQSTNELRELALFAGAGGGILAGHLLGWRTICAVERDAYAAGILAQRQNDGCLAPFPIWSDVTTFDGKPWRGRVDVVSGGFPCQDISTSGHKRGIEGERSGLWKEMLRIICEVKPRFVFVENVAALLNRGMGVVLGDLAKAGFDAQWRVLGTSDVGGDQLRERVWIVASTEGVRWRSILEEPGLLQKTGKGRARLAGGCRANNPANTRRVLRQDQSRICRVADGVADRVDRIKAAGNGQDPRVAAAAFAQLAGRE